MTADLVPAGTSVPAARRQAEVSLSRILESIAELRHEFSTRANLRTQFRLHPWPFLGAAFAFGFYLGTIHLRK